MGARSAYETVYNYTGAQAVPPLQPRAQSFYFLYSFYYNYSYFLGARVRAILLYTSYNFRVPRCELPATFAPLLSRRQHNCCNPHYSLPIILIIPIFTIIRPYNYFLVSRNYKTSYYFFNTRIF